MMTRFNNHLRTFIDEDIWKDALHNNLSHVGLLQMQIAINIHPLLQEEFTELLKSPKLSQSLGIADRLFIEGLLQERSLTLEM